MKRSISFVQTRTTLYEAMPLLDQRPQLDFNRFIYINTEEAHKEKHTIFHSPYKGGRKNPNYTNPSFMSSDVFYPRDYSADEHSKSKPKVALIPTKNDITYQEQYKSRIMRKSYSGACLNKPLISEKSKKVLEPLQLNIQRNIQREVQKDRSPMKINNKILRKIEDSKQLKQQLELLKRSLPKHHEESTNKQTPIYLQSRSSILNRMLKKETSKRQLINEMNRTLKRKQEEKWQMNHEKKNQKTLIDREAQRFYAGIKSSNQFQRQRARLLSELLLQQILQRN